MGKDNEQHWRKQLTWGIILTGAGVAFLLDHHYFESNKEHYDGK